MNANNTLLRMPKLDQLEMKKRIGTNTTKNLLYLLYPSFSEIVNNTLDELEEQGFIFTPALNIDVIDLKDVGDTFSIGFNINVVSDYETAKKVEEQLYSKVLEDFGRIPGYYLDSFDVVEEETGYNIFIGLFKEEN